MKKIIKSVALLLSLNMFVTIGYSQSDILVPGDYMKYKELYEEAQKAKSEWEVVIKKINEQTIDLGLSVRWATCNLGASASENAGNYYAWGDVSANVSHGSSYRVSSNACENDEKTGLEILKLDYDAAHEALGKGFHIPTEADWQELMEKCTWTWTKLNNVEGYKVVGKNGNSIFIPASGYHLGDYLYNKGKKGHYWTSMKNGSFSKCFLMNSSKMKFGSELPYLSFSIRPVVDVETIMSKYENMKKIAEQMNQYIQDIHNSWKKPYVDLGLSVKWATCNLGATSPEKTGNYYAWGETKPKNTYNSSTYSGDSKDAAKVNLGEHWRMPTEDEVSELFANCTITWATVNGVNGFIVYIDNLASSQFGQSIFLPESGGMVDNVVEKDENLTLLWISKQIDNKKAKLIVFEGRKFPRGKVVAVDKFCGLPIRPVYVE